MAYERRGSGPPVVFLHGWCLTGRLWTYQEAALLNRFDVVVPDLPGFGRSDGLPGPFTFERQARAVGALLEEENLEDASLVGFAYGGVVALHVAREYAARLASVAVVGVPTPGHTPNERMLRSMRRDWPAYARRSALALCRRPGSDATAAWLEAMFAGTRLAVALETWQEASDFDSEPISEQVTVPTLFVHGADDEFTPVATAEACARAARGSVAVADDCGHLVMLDRPEWFQQTLDNFLVAS
jgi:pimeloyl-ACP methyl ester carboxylesterase